MFSFLRDHQADVAALPHGAAHIRVTKNNLRISHPSISRAKAQDVLADITLREARPGKAGLDLIFNNSLRGGRSRDRIHIRIDWQNNTVQGANPHSATFAALLEQIGHRMRDRHPDHYRAFIAHALTESRTDADIKWGFKYTGDTPLYPTATIVRSSSGEWAP